MTNDFKQSIRSLTRGRARLRHPSLRGLGADNRKNFESMIMSAPGVLSASINPRSGSLLVTWDENETSPEALLEAAEFFFSMAEFDNDDETNCQKDNADDNQCCGDYALAGLLESSKKTLVRAADKGVSAADGAVKTLESTGFFGLLDLVAPVIAADQVKHGSKRTRRVTQNRLMLLSYALSIGALGVQSKAAHWVIGTLFTAFLGLHLYQHKRVL